jgi:hypothetical protein
MSSTEKFVYGFFAGADASLSSESQDRHGSIWLAHTWFRS